MPSEPLAADRPTRVRYGVLSLVCLLSMITYLDRVCFGSAAPLIAGELGLDGQESLKWAFTAFAIAYGVFEIPSGRLGDRLGPRGTLLRIVGWWSLCTVLTGLVGLRVGGVVLGGVGTLIGLRFLFGAGEAGAYPNITRVVHNWFPRSSWETAQGLVWMSGRIMGGLTPLVWALLVTGLGDVSPVMTWRGAFGLFGLVGLSWCALFAMRFRNRPDEHPRVNEAERMLIGGDDATAAAHDGVPWRELARNGSLWTLCLMYAGITYGWYFNITYLPGYVDSRFQPPPGELTTALAKGAPLWVGAIGCGAGGFCVRRLTRRLGDQGRARRWLGMTALSLCAVCWFAATRATTMLGFCSLAAAAALLNDLTMGSAWAACQDVGRRHAAVVAATMNTAGTVGAALAGWLTGTIVQRARDAGRGLAAGYDDVFLSYAAVYVLAAVCWRFIDAERSTSTRRAVD